MADRPDRRAERPYRSLEPTRPRRVIGPRACAYPSWPGAPNRSRREAEDTIAVDPSPSPIAGYSSGPRPHRHDRPEGGDEPPFRWLSDPDPDPLTEASRRSEE